MNITFPSIFINPAADYFSQEFPFSSHKHTISKMALDTLKCTAKACIQTGLFAAKLVVVPLEVAAIAVVATLMAISLLASLPFSATVAEGKKITLYHRLRSVVDDLIEITWITIKYGVVKEEEEYRYADARPNSPKFVVIQPDFLCRRPAAKPTLYAPGYLDSPDSLRETCRNMANNYGGTVYIVKYRNLFQSIKEHAEDVARVAERIIRDTNKNEIILAGHSMGGLVTGCSVLNNLPPNVDVRLWITIASPLKGDPLAPIGIGDCAKDMNLDSSLIKQINDPSRLDDIPSLHIYSLVDPIVPPAYAHRHGRPKATNYVCTNPHGHLSIRACSEVDQQIQQAMMKI
jgi:hypothetical protein